MVDKMYTIIHLDRDYGNNYVGNLAWITRYDNTGDYLNYI